MSGNQVESAALSGLLLHRRFPCAAHWRRVRTLVRIIVGLGSTGDSPKTAGTSLQVHVWGAAG